MRVDLRIEHLVVDGFTFGPDGSADLEQALRGQMARQLRHHGIVGAAPRTVTLTEVVPSPIALPARPDAGCVGARIAESLGSVLPLARMSRGRGST